MESLDIVKEYISLDILKASFSFNEDFSLFSMMTMIERVLDKDVIGGFESFREFLDAIADAVGLEELERVECAGQEVSLNDKKDAFKRYYCSMFAVTWVAITLPATFKCFLMSQSFDDEYLSVIQKSLQIEYGDNAGLFFSDILLDWSFMPLHERYPVFCAYIAQEDIAEVEYLEHYKSLINDIGSLFDTSRVPF